MSSTTITPARWAALAGLAAAAGLRSATPAAGLASHRPGTPAAVKAAFGLAALGELAADKHPKAPSRSSPPGMASRLFAGAATGYAATRRPEAAAVCGVIAMAAGSGAARLRAQLGTATGLPDPVIAVFEDAAAIGLTGAVVDSALG